MWLSAVGLALGVFACRDVTAPFFGLPGTSTRLLNPTGAVVVSPGNMHGWALANDQTNSACTDGAVCLFVQGPGTPPTDTGSAELATPLASDGKALVLADYKGTRFDAITELRYATYRQSADAGNNLAIALQFNVDYDLTDQATGYQGRLVFEPYQGIGGNVPQNTWQSWDAKAGKWWGTKASVPVNGILRTNACVQATPCTWTQLLAAFPNLGVHASYGAVVLKAGSNWAGFRGNVDMLSIGINGATTTFDFEPSQPVPAQAPDSISNVLWDSLTAPANLMIDAPSLRGRWVRNVMLITFKRAATLQDRRTVIGLIQGEVVGGNPPLGDDGEYIVKIPYATAPGDSISGPVLRAFLALRGHPSLVTAYPVGMDKGSVLHYRRPIDGAGFTVWPTWRDSGTGPNWGHVAVNAPYAWGCVTGTEAGISHPALAVVDVGIHDANDLRPSYGPVQEFTEASGTEQHGTEIASIIGGAGNNHDGVTGMLWQARVSLYNAERNPPPTAHVSARGVWPYNLRRAVHDGARVVNVSWGLEVSNVATKKTLADTIDLWIRADPYIKAIEATRDPGTGRLSALFVVSAGNDKGDTFWAGWGYVRSLPAYANNIIIVGAAKRSGATLAMVDGTNGGSSVDIMAPGENVGVVTFPFLGPDTPALASGTSFAAPFVVGVAGMLLSNDPSLTPDSVKSLILLGANVKPRPVSDAFDPTRPKPFLDAYESLRLLATNRGAPLCGNRVYEGGDQLYVQRGQGRESLGPIPTNTWAINAQHGGRRVEVLASAPYAFTYGPTGWSRTQMANRPRFAQADGGTFHGVRGYNHDGDSVITVQQTGDILQLRVRDSASTAVPAPRGAGYVLPPLPFGRTNLCDVENAYRPLTDSTRWTCRSARYSSGGIAGSRSGFAQTVSPIDGSVLVAVGSVSEGEVGGPAAWFDCLLGQADLYHCRGTRTYKRQIDDFRIIRFDGASGNPQLITMQRRGIPITLTMSEDGKELLVSYEDWPNGYTYSETNVGWGIQGSYPVPSKVCRTEALPVTYGPSGAVSFGTPVLLASESATSCPTGSPAIGITTFSPSRAPKP